MMVENSGSKKRLFYIIVLILTLIVMIIGATIAYYLLVASQKEDATVLYTGTLKINYIDGVYMKDPELYPKKEVTFDTYEGVYRNRFSVASAGTLDQNISIDMVVTRNDFKPNALKYAIYNTEGLRLVTGYLPPDGSVPLARNIYLAHDATATYTLIIWWDNTSYNQNDEMGSIVSGRIDVFAKQIRY